MERVGQVWEAWGGRQGEGEVGRWGAPIWPVLGVLRGVGGECGSLDGALGGDRMCASVCGGWLGGGDGWASCGGVEGEDSYNAAQQTSCLLNWWRSGCWLA